jgi:hypothetical protein
MIELEDAYGSADFIMDGITPIPHNLFVCSETAPSISERHDLEQFFWTKNTVDKLMTSLGYNYTEETCCFTTPSLAHALHEQGTDETLLDIDTRFSYLPKFRYYDACSPYHTGETYRLLVIDPPF